jgi:hypothetical protein
MPPKHSFDALLIEAPFDPVDRGVKKTVQQRLILDHRLERSGQF